MQISYFKIKKITKDSPSIGQLKCGTPLLKRHYHNDNDMARGAEEDYPHTIMRGYPSKYVFYLFAQSYPW